MHCQMQNKAMFLFFQVVPRNSEVCRSCKQTTEVEGETKVQSAKTNTVSGVPVFPEYCLYNGRKKQ